jgi:hypothetical protein
MENDGFNADLSLDDDDQFNTDVQLDQPEHKLKFPEVAFL